MNDIVRGLLGLVLGLSVVADAVETQEKQATPAERYKAMAEEFFDLTQVVAFKAKNDEERIEAVARVDKLRLRLLDLAEKNPRDPIALDALVQVVKLEIWMENNTAHPGDGKDSPQVEAITRLLRDHVRSDRLGEACRMVHYGFHRECETFLRTVLEKNPHKDVQAVACLRLAQFLNARSQRFDLIKGQPELARRYEGLFGKDYLEALQRQDRAKASEEIEALFEQAAEKYADVKLPAGSTVGEQAKLELYTIRHLSVGKQAPDVEGADQDGKRFKLSDYRGKVVLLYFWSEF
jgi:hypothetical protein